MNVIEQWAVSTQKITGKIAIVIGASLDVRVLHSDSPEPPRHIHWFTLVILARQYSASDLESNNYYTHLMPHWFSEASLLSSCKDGKINLFIYLEVSIQIESLFKRLQSH